MTGHAPLIQDGACRRIIPGGPLTDDRVCNAPIADHVCDCGHVVSLHQTGKGAWTGFCAGGWSDLSEDDREWTVPDDFQCKCEMPTYDNEPISGWNGGAS